MEEKIFELMAHAEDLQKHAAQLQEKAQETFSALPLAVEQAQKKIRSTGLQMALIMFGLSVLACGLTLKLFLWSTESLKEKREALKVEIQAEEARLAELQSKTWSLELVNDNGRRGIILPKNVNFVGSATLKDGREVMIIEP
jgi:DNA repair exonuclease SbcCD ATPase subunit